MKKLQRGLSEGSAAQKYQGKDTARDQNICDGSLSALMQSIYKRFTCHVLIIAERQFSK